MAVEMLEGTAGQMVRGFARNAMTVVLVEIITYLHTQRCQRHPDRPVFLKEKKKRDHVTMEMLGAGASQVATKDSHEM